MRHLLLSCTLLALIANLGCGGTQCTEIDCDSTLEVDYGEVVVNEPYELTINPGGTSVTVTCLANSPDAEPLPDWLDCDAGGFVITGELADTTTTMNVAVVPLSTEEAVIPNALVALNVDELIEPNGPDCDPRCVVRRGSVEDS
ncbi:hypothetical protein G6O69_27235 [Pseudenhygromyxa sp. WMMC2535]|uniref:hypothetical protein n=1 Tax=Pseudenhygromyxa sp. WMMC2535 TaxID=2712867 RepID=UPI00155823AD|nr:hypothetical protein [Pseudenhygromyxa sp. WMMC2535]NVB41563.1 hypothetical protein [Pseudenhygromyxa sp. WMMC2535]